VHLRAMTEGEEVVEDYVAMRLSLRAHPLALLRAALSPPQAAAREAMGEAGGEAGGEVRGEVRGATVPGPAAPTRASALVLAQTPAQTPTQTPAQTPAPTARDAPDGARRGEGAAVIGGIEPPPPAAASAARAARDAQVAALGPGEERASPPASRETPEQRASRVPDAARAGEREGSPSPSLPAAPTRSVAAAPSARPMHAGARSMPPWPRPPACLRAADLHLPAQNARVAVAGLVIVRQRPGTAKGVVFVTLEDETGVINVIIWQKVYEIFRRQIIAGRLLRVTGRVQREGEVVHVLAERVEDISALLDDLARGAREMPDPAGPTDEVRRPPDDARAGARGAARPGAGAATHPRGQARRLFPSRDFH
jgi:hypothetical protein